MSNVAFLAILALAFGPAEDAYRRSYLGDFARAGRCAETEAQWQFERSQIRIGTTRCAIAGISDADGVLTVSVNRCAGAGAAAAERQITLDIVSADVVRATDGAVTAMLRRCAATTATTQP